MPRRTRKLTPRSYRKPPRPETWNSPRGWCRLCGTEIVENGKQNRRKNWHTHCVHEWKIMSDPIYAKRFVHVRDRGRCQAHGCDFFSVRPKDFDLDHVEPLFEAHGDLGFYREGNLQILCKPCHKVKTKGDMKRYHSGRITEVDPEESRSHLQGQVEKTGEINDFDRQNSEGYDLDTDPVWQEDHDSY